MTRMELALRAACTLSLHTLLAAVACAALSATAVPGFAAWRGALIRPAAVAVLVAAAGLALGVLSGADPGGLLEPVRVVVPGCFTAAGAIAALGCHLVLHAAREEAAHGATPRRLLRTAGQIMFAGAALVGALSSLALARWTVLPGALACGAGGCGGLLAGISGKPRPSGHLAAIAYALGMTLLCAAGRGTG
jgi:hypothetical protein